MFPQRKFPYLFPLFTNIKSVAIAIAFGTVFCMSTTAQAGVLWHSTFYLPGPLGNPTAEETYVNTLLSSSYVYLDKIDGGRVNDGALGALGTLSGADGLATTNVSWNLLGTDYGLSAILIKDGNVPGIGHLYSLFTIEASQTKVGDSTNLPSGLAFYEPLPPDYLNKGISHITFLGSLEDDTPPGGNPVVPEPASMITWGVLTGFALVPAVRRRRRSRIAVV